MADRINENNKWEVIKYVLNEWIIGLRCVFGPFGRLFRVYPHYGLFLNLESHQDEESPISLNLSLQKINKIFQNKSQNQINKGIKNLLSSKNWRTHIVGCVAIIKLKSENQKLYIERLWGLVLNNESWVFPQILATLSIIDPDFSTKIGRKELLKKFKKNKELVQEIEFLLNPEIRVMNNQINPVFGLPWKINLIKLIEEGKL